MGQTNDTPAERRTPEKPPARRSPVPPRSTATPRGNPPARRVASEQAGAADTSRSTAADRPAANGTRPLAPVSPLSSTSGNDRILVFSTQRDLPGREQQQTPPEEPPMPVTPAPDPVAPASLPRARALPIRRREDAGEGDTGSMVSLGDSLRDFVAVLEERRRRRLAEGRDRGEPVVLRSDLDEVCPLCGGAGYLRRDVPVGHPLFGQPVPCECKERELEERRHQEEEARLAQLDRFFSLSPFGDKTFETFDAEWKGAELNEAYSAARRFAADPRGWLVLAGPPGVGKTHLAAAVARELLAAGSSVFFAIVPDLLDHLRAAFAPTSDLTYDEMFECVREVQLLVLDDFGAQNSTPWASEKLFQLVNHRYNLRMLTVITTNQRLLSQLDERVQSRLGDRGFVRRVDITGQDYRRHNIGRGRRQR